MPIEMQLTCLPDVPFSSMKDEIITLMNVGSFQRKPTFWGHFKLLRNVNLTTETCG